MGAVLLAIGVALAALAAALVGLLFVPADFVISARTGTGVRFRLRWLFGIVRVGDAGRPRPRRAARPRETAEQRAAKRERARAKRRRPGRRLRTARALRGLLAIDGLLPGAARLVRGLIRSLGWRWGRLAVRAGAGDPAVTGEICGLVEPLLVWLPPRPALRVAFEPDFAEAVFEAEAQAAGRFVPGRAAAALGRFALSRPGLRAAKVLLWDSRR